MFLRTITEKRYGFVTFFNPDTSAQGSIEWSDRKTEQLK